MVDTELTSSDGVPSPQAPRRGAVAFIFVTILLDMLALGIIMPILPKLIESFVANDTAQAARIFGLFGTAWALMQFIFSPVLGSLSDRFGRRPVVLLSNFGLAADYVLMALAPSLVWLFIGRVISGITSASISTAFAYIADVTPPERRAAVFGKIGRIRPSASMSSRMVTKMKAAAPLRTGGVSVAGADTCSLMTDACACGRTDWLFRAA